MHSSRDGAPFLFLLFTDAFNIGALISFFFDALHDYIFSCRNPFLFRLLWLLFIFKDSDRYLEGGGYGRGQEMQG